MTMQILMNDELEQKFYEIKDKYQKRFTNNHSINIENLKEEKNTYEKLRINERIEYRVYKEVFKNLSSILLKTNKNISKEHKELIELLQRYEIIKTNTYNNYITAELNIKAIENLIYQEEMQAQIDLEAENIQFLK